MGFLDDSVSVLNATLQEAAGVTGTYRRGNDSIDNLPAIPGRVAHFDAGEEGLTLTGREKDWIVWVNDLAFAGERTQPQRGDEFDIVDEFGVLHTYRVLPRTGDMCWRYTDPTHRQFRIYTVEQRQNAE